MAVLSLKPLSFARNACTLYLTMDFLLSILTNLLFNKVAHLALLVTNLYSVLRVARICFVIVLCTRQFGDYLHGAEPFTLLYPHR